MSNSSDPYKLPPRSSGSIPPPPVATDLQPDQRFTVQTLEERMRQRSDRDYSTVRSRRHRRSEEAGSGRLLWLSVFAVVVVYLGVVSYSVLFPKPKKAAPTPSAPAAKIAVPPVEVPDATTQETSVNTVMVKDMIGNWKRAQQLFDEGRRYHRNRQYAQAEQKLESAIQLTPYHMPALMELAALLREQKRHGAARDVLLRVLSIDPSENEARLRLAQTYAQLNDYENALAMAGWMLEIEQYNVEALQISADIYTATGQDDKALVYWQKVAALNSANLNAKNSMGAAQLRLGLLPQAVATFEGVIRTDAANSLAHYYLALAYVKKEEPELAVDVLVQATSRFGYSFVLAWTLGAEFNPIRDNPYFRKKFVPELETSTVVVEAE